MNKGSTALFPKMENFMYRGLFCAAVLTALGALSMTGSVEADEGMWLFNNPPTKHLKEKYKFEPTEKWLDHVQKSSVRFNSGGSGSFVSPDGLVMTNHHVGADALQKMSTADKNYLRDGFYAKSPAEEQKCLDLELNVLMSIEDVTDRVNAAVKPDMSAADAFAARRAVTAEIEKESLEKTKLRSNVITLYQGGLYHLYRFKKYTDVRLVFAPELQIAFFGGDPDNFEYPRYDLDVCFFRVYENGQPARLDHYLRWSNNGCADGELVFVSGHPGRTNRLNTVADLEYLRDRQYPLLLQLLNRREVLYSSYSARSEENARRAKDELFGVQNSRKARLGGLAGLMDPVIMGKKREAEKALRDAVANMKDNPQAAKWATAWSRVEGAVKKQQELAQDYNLYEGARAFNTQLYSIARTLLRAGDERPKPNGERFDEFRESNLESLQLSLFSEEPIYDDFEQLKLADSLAYLAEQLGYDHPRVQKILAGKSPQERAATLVKETNVKDVEFRKKLWEGGAAAVKNANDPMIELARLVDAEARRLRKILDSEVMEVKQQAYADIAKLKFALEGTNTYPDATFTLRLSYGDVTGYPENGKTVAPFTDFSGLYQRSKEHHNKPPFDLPPRWIERREQLDLKTPYNFVSTCDIIGGNSGSPVINKAGEVVGIIFDGNIQSLVLDFTYTNAQARAVSVDSRAIIEALRKVYDAKDLADELTGKKVQTGRR
jgi:hypothetical protein